MSGVYWGLSALWLTGHMEYMDKKDVIEWVLSCQHANGSFGATPEHDGSLLYTLSAVQILLLYGEEGLLDAGTVADCAPCFSSRKIMYVFETS